MGVRVPSKVRGEGREGYASRVSKCEFLRCDSHHETDFEPSDGTVYSESS